MSRWVQVLLFSPVLMEMVKRKGRRTEMKLLILYICWQWGKSHTHTCLPSIHSKVSSLEFLTPSPLPWQPLWYQRQDSIRWISYSFRTSRKAGCPREERQPPLQPCSNPEERICIAMDTNGNLLSICACIVHKLKKWTSLQAIQPSLNEVEKQIDKCCLRLVLIEPLWNEFWVLPRQFSATDLQ